MPDREHLILSADEIFGYLAKCLAEKRPLPPDGWRASGYTEELWNSSREYDPDPIGRQRDAIAKSFYYLADFARSMPEWINLSLSNPHVAGMCRELAEEIVNITQHPDEVISKREKLKARLYAILSVQTSLIYTWETERVITERDQERRKNRLSLKRVIRRPDLPRNESLPAEMARQILSRLNLAKRDEEVTEQGSLF